MICDGPSHATLWQHTDRPEMPFLGFFSTENKK